ncbi:hypothetical protein WKW50_25715, partial [Ochrobactrum sp. GPK 3]
ELLCQFRKRLLTLQRGKCCFGLEGRAAVPAWSFAQFDSPVAAISPLSGRKSTETTVQFC